MRFIAPSGAVLDICYEAPSRFVVYAGHEAIGIFSDKEDLNAILREHGFSPGPCEVIFEPQACIDCGFWGTHAVDAAAELSVCESCYRKRVAK